MRRTVSAKVRTVRDADGPQSEPCHLMSDWRDPQPTDGPDQDRPLDETPDSEGYGTLSEADAGLAPAESPPAGTSLSAPESAPETPVNNEDSEAVTSLVHAIESRMEEVRRLGEDLSDRESSMSARVVDLDRRAAEVSAKLASLDADRAQLAARESAVREQSESIERKETELRRRMEEAEARLNSIESREKDLADQDAALCNRAQSLESQASTAQMQDQSISNREQAIDGRARAVEDAEREIESLKQELESEREKLRDTALRLKQEHAALTEMKSAALEQNDRSLEERERDLAQLRASLDMERDRLEQQWQEFEANKASMLDGGAPAITSFEQQQQLEDREQELEDARLNVETERERLEEMAEQLHNDRASVQRERSTVEVDRDRGAAMAAIGAAMDKTLEECQIRRDRLRKVRIALRERSAKLDKAREIIRGRHKECERILAMRDRVARAQEEVETQREQIGRQADRSRVAGVLMKLVISIAILGGLSWAIADRVAPTMNLTQATISAQASNGALDESAQTMWTQYCESLAMDPRLMEETAARLKRRGVEALATPGAVSAYFDESLNVDSQRPGELNIALKGEGGAATRRILETYLASFVAIANDAKGQQLGQASTIVSANAAVDATPLRDDRLKWAGAMWGGATLLILIIGWALWTRLAVSASRSENIGSGAFGVG